MITTSNPMVVPTQSFDTWYQTALAVSSPVDGPVSVEIIHRLVRYVDDDTMVPSHMTHHHMISDLLGFAAYRASQGDTTLRDAISTLISVIDAVVGEIDPAGPQQTFSEVPK